MKKIVLIAVISIPVALFAQKKTPSSQTVDLGISIGNEFGISSSYFYNWQLGKSKKFEIGLGARYSGLFGKDLQYITAPAKLTSGKTGPGVLFAENIKTNIDSLLIQKPQTNSINIALELGYNITPKFYAAFNIDLIGFSFGKKFNDGLYVKNNAGTTGISGKPTGFNALLISDNDRGSLNSELFLRYKLNNKWAIHGGLGFLFSEYTADTKVQQVPGPNDRFRYKSAGALLGVTYLIKN
jgi:hypothetical protein